jgi:hypothetical protein
LVRKFTGYLRKICTTAAAAAKSKQSVICSTGSETARHALQAHELNVAKNRRSHPTRDWAPTQETVRTVYTKKMDSTYVVWYVSLLGGTVVALAGIAIATPRRYENVVSPLVFKAGVLVMVAAFAWQGGLMAAFSSIKPFLSNVDAAASHYSSLVGTTWLALGEGFLLMLLHPLLEILASKCARHTD